MSKFDVTMSSLLSRKKEIEIYNKAIFDKRYTVNFRYVEDLFGELFSLNKIIIKDSYLAFIRESYSVSKQHILLELSSRSKILSKIIGIAFCFIMRFTYYKGDKNESCGGICFLERYDNRFYDELIQLINKKKPETNIRICNDNKVMDVYGKKIGVSFNVKQLSFFFKNIKMVLRVINRLESYQRPIFLKMFRLNVLYQRFYMGMSRFDYIIDSRDNAYLPFQNSLANNNNVKLILIQNGARTDLLMYGYIRCFMFVSWSDIYKKIIVGDIESDSFFSVLPSSMNRMDAAKTKQEYFKKNSKYDFLIVEQLDYPESGAGADYFNHKYMLSRVVSFLIDHPEYKVGYLCRHSRDIKQDNIRYDVLRENDEILLKNNIAIIERKFCEWAIKSSKVTIAINSSTRVEAFMVGNIGFSVSKKMLPYDWIIKILPDEFSSINESQSVFNEKMLSVLNLDTSDINAAMRTQHTMLDVVDEII